MIVYKNREEIQRIRHSNQIVAQILAELRTMIEPGIPTRELNAYAEKRTKELKAVPAFKGYRDFPASLCTSLNEEIVHGIPSSRILREGDIISLDFGVVCDGYYGDAAVTYPVGKVTPEAENLIVAAEKAFTKGLEKMTFESRISDISSAIQNCVESQGYSVIRNFVGHGIGLSLHEEPQIPNFGLPGRGPKIKEGMVLAIEPMIAAGDWNVEILSDNWTAVTRDRSLSAHYEHTVAMTAEGPVILSQLDEEQSLLHAKESQYA
jgi:methionyl aminopeptidase